MKPTPRSYWLSTTSKKQFPSSIPSETFDVAIVGGGIVGIVLASYLTQSQKKVIVLEAGKILQGVTGHTTAKVTSLHTLIYHHLINHLGKENAKIYADAQQSSLEAIAQMITRLEINADFIRAGAYTYTTDQNRLQEIEKEVEAAQALGLPATFTTKTELPFAIKGAIRFDHQAHFHPLKLLYALAQELIHSHSSIVEGVRVVDVEEGETCIVATNKGNLKARNVVIATNYPILDRGGFHTRLTPYRSYVLGAYLKEKVLEGMYISIDQPLYSLRPQPTEKGDLLIITGFEHITGQGEKEDYFDALAQIMKKHFKIKSIAYRWATHDNHTIDNLPYVGKYLPTSKHLYVATGFAGWGMTNGVAAARLLYDQILGITNPYAKVVDPHRTEQLKAAKQFITQNVGVGQEFIKGKLKKDKPQSLDSLKPGDGTVIDHQGQKVAVFKNAQGKLSSVSAVCQHLGCIVNFNSTEKSWDCPCHGSRYDTQGNILHAPTVKPLPKVKQS